MPSRIAVSAAARSSAAERSAPALIASVRFFDAVSRIALDGLVDNVQASWVKLGLDGAGLLLGAGCNDLGGTLAEESISRAAGGAHGQALTPQRLEAAIDAAGRVPTRRSTLYEVLTAAD